MKAINCIGAIAAVMPVAYIVLVGAIGGMDIVSFVRFVLLAILIAGIGYMYSDLFAWDYGLLKYHSRSTKRLTFVILLNLGIGAMVTFAVREYVLAVEIGDTEALVALLVIAFGVEIVHSLLHIVLISLKFVRWHLFGRRRYGEKIRHSY